MNIHRIPYASTGRFTPLVCDYLEGKEELADLHGPRPDLEGLRKAAAERTFPAEHRLVLAEVLEEQYAGMDLPDAVRSSLEALRDPRSLTVTTGHQLCLFTGPLYVPFKLLNVIRLAHRLAYELERPVVPIFWMATEDHDRPEIDHAMVGGQRVHWPGAMHGAVGRLPLEGIGAVVEETSKLLGTGAEADRIRELLIDCYRPEFTLAHATRRFVHALFGRFGLVVLDADDPRLKQLFVPVMEQEVLHQITQRTVHFANDKLEGSYGVQAHAREINLFHLRPGQRSRIEREGDLFKVQDNGPAFTADELLAELRRRPEDFSPNVLMRPIYQETILPNIAYLGGGGELAYWLQLRWLFQSVQLPMPVLMLRTSAMFLSEKAGKRKEQLGLSLKDMFRPAADLRNLVALSFSDLDPSLEEQEALMIDFYGRLTDHMMGIDPTLGVSVDAFRNRALKGLKALEKKGMRAIRRHQRVDLERLDRLLEEAFPAGALQERRDNFLPFLATEGDAFLDRLLAELDPLDPRFTVFVG